jgi:hypothetical protein
MAGNRLPDQKHTVDVRLHELFPLRMGKLFERRAALHASVVDQNIDRSDLTFDALNGRLYVGCGRHIEASRVCDCAFGVQPANRLGQRRFAAGIQNDLGPRGGQSFC